MNFLPNTLLQPEAVNKFGNPAQSSNPYGFTAPMGPATQALVPYYNKATGETWNAPSGGYTPPSADWIQGYPGSSQITPMPGFAPGYDLVQPTPNAPVSGLDYLSMPQQPMPAQMPPSIGQNVSRAIQNVSAALRPQQPMPAQMPPSIGQNVSRAIRNISAALRPQQPTSAPVISPLNSQILRTIQNARGLVSRFRR